MVGRLCSVMLTADWSWRGKSTVLHNGNVTEKRGEKEEREPESVLSAEFNQRFT